MLGGINYGIAFSDRRYLDMLRVRDEPKCIFNGVYLISLVQPNSIPIPDT